MQNHTIVTLKKGEGRTIKAGGAWIFDNEIDTIVGTFTNGDIVMVHDFDGYPMGKGFINQNSKIRIRMMTRHADQEIDTEFLRMRVQNAWDYRKQVMAGGNDRVLGVEEAEKMLPGMQEIYGDMVDSIILYGSTACGTRAEDLDVDVAILLRAGATKAMRDQMLDLVVDLELECGRVLSVLCIDYDKFAEWKDIIPFYKNIRKDGVVLWQAA